MVAVSVSSPNVRSELIITVRMTSTASRGVSNSSRASRHGDVLQRLPGTRQRDRAPAAGTGTQADVRDSGSSLTVGLLFQKDRGLEQYGIFTLSPYRKQRYSTPNLIPYGAGV